jgi:HEAT repeat protein
MMRIACVCTLAVCSASSSTAHEPTTYQGKTVAEWRKLLLAEVGWLQPPRGNFPLRAKPDPEAVPLLLELSRDQDPVVRILTVRCIVCLGERAKPLAGRLTEMLGDPRDGVKYEIAVAAEVLGPEVFAQSLKAFRDQLRAQARKSPGDPVGRECALAYLALSSDAEDKEAVGWITTGILRDVRAKNIDFHVLARHLGALARLASAHGEVDAFFVDMLASDIDEGTKEAVLDALGQRTSSSKKLTDTVQPFLRHRYGLTRARAARAYYRLTQDADSVLPTLRALVHPKTEGMQLEASLEAVEAMGKAARELRAAVDKVAKECEHESIRAVANRTLKALE